MTVEFYPFSAAVEDVSRGNAKVPQSAYLDAGKLPVIDQGQRPVAGYTDDMSLRCRIDGPLIIFGDHTRAFKFIDFPFVVGADGVKLLRVREGWDAKYVYHYLASRAIPSAGYSRHFKFLKEIRIPRPPLEEQCRVAAILDKADLLDASYRRELVCLDELSRSIFNDMFGHPRSSRYPGVSLPNICALYSGATPPKANMAFWSGSFPWFSPKDLKTENLWDSSDHIDSMVTSQTSLRRLPPDTVVLVVRGMILARTVPIAILRCEGAINQDLKALLPRVPINAQFLAACLRAQQDQILNSVSTAAHGTKRLDARALKAIQILRPGVDLEVEFARRVRLIEEMRNRLTQSYAIRRALDAALRAHAFACQEL